MASQKWVGQSLKRTEDPALLTGRGSFVGDPAFSNLCHAATAPALLANAVSDALKRLRIRIDELPITPSRLWNLMEASRGTAR